METNKLIAGIVAAAIAIIVLAGVLMPALSNATETEDTFTNNGAFFVELNPTDSYTLEFNNSTDNDTIFVNGEGIDLNKDYTVLAIENAILRYSVSSHKFDWNGDGSYLTGITVLDLTIGSGTITGTYITNGSSTSWPSTEYEKCYIASPDKQSLVMSSYNEPVKMNGDSEIFAFGRTVLNDNGSNKQYLIKIEGNIDDGVNVTIANVSTGATITTAVITDLSINAVQDDNHIDLYTLNSITFKAQVSENDTASNVTFTAYIIPAEVTAEKAQHLTDAQIVILDVIPLLIIVSVLLGVVAVFILRRE